MSDIREKTKVGIDEAATKTKHAAEKVAESGKVVAGEMDRSKSNSTDERKDAIHERPKPADSAVESVADKATELASGARAVVERAAEKSQEVCEQFVDHTRDGMRHAGAIVRANPVSTITLAFAAGIGVGLLLGLTPQRRKDRWSFMR